MICSAGCCVQGREAEAAGVLQQSVVVTHEMAQELIARLRCAFPPAAWGSWGLPLRGGACCGPSPLTTHRLHHPPMHPPKHPCEPCIRQQRVEFVVAPYEADAQLAHLSSLPEWQGGVAAGAC